MRRQDGGTPYGRVALLRDRRSQFPFDAMEREMLN